MKFILLNCVSNNSILQDFLSAVELQESKLAKKKTAAASTDDTKSKVNLK